MSKLKLPAVDTITEPVIDNVQAWWRRMPSRGELVPKRLKQARHPWRTTAFVVGAAGFGVITGYAILYFADPVRGHTRREEARKRAIMGMHGMKGGVDRIQGEVIRLVHSNNGAGNVVEPEMTELRRQAR